MSKAIKVGRLSACIERNDRGQPKIRDAAAADAEWDKTTKPPPVASEPTGEEDYNYAEESAREKHWKANLAKLEYETKAGELVRADEARGVVLDRFTEVRTKLLGLPVRIKQRIPHLSAEDVHEIDAVVREALEGLARGD